MRVPVLATERDTVLHRRDPRVKWLVFAILIAFLYTAPTWPWMLAMTGVGLGLAWAARTPPKWLAILWALQIPNFAGLVLVPVVSDLLAHGHIVLDASMRFGLKLGFAWSAALFVSIALFSTMHVDQLVDGLHGLRLPHVAGFTLGYTFLLMYTSLADIFRITDAMKVKGLRLETRNPARLLAGLPRLMIPAVFTIIRRANTMMAVLEMRGFSASTRGRRQAPMSFGPADAALLACAAAALGIALFARVGLLPTVI